MTSGTTGLPKLVVRSHEALLMNARIFASISNESASTSFLKNTINILNVLCAAGQPVDKDWSEILDKITRSACFAYGLSEVGYCCSQLCATSSDVLPYVVGYPSAEGIEVKVVDENQQETSPNTHGELLVRAPWMFDGYLGNEEKSKSEFTQDRWFKTDDLAYKDNDGCLFVMCRRSDAIAWGVRTVYPSYLEKPIGSLSVIADVIIVPVPDKDRFQEICACVILCEGITLNEKEVADTCNSLFVKGTCAPKYYMVMDNFPYLSSAKPDKLKLISMAKERFNLN
ncbi:3-[(3aS,4S,7aS)-7a-methyl-1,5-dioxo-octahydro-1H-inden-4-yl]propanoyl:CoA ligase-like [Gigantopelta aegis]|uniref:3-[(3aS,4S,7aS)-7a-methyl-1, 5-dioxo-octahydro-1H-inden-4-yl]propanoyl:CoA ligase-like n=1 Tax=Gigantopelta aegis TaxID=1735272 RepID=UPI001B88899E|nr:3-[(3aS,4S,7aS)-7a-methyl-1,5-dioxo-octahydro-1H-inden-4-yl]propanoyl:CoA ligase-like [Gigantopelta aegis]